MKMHMIIAVMLFIGLGVALDVPDAANATSNVSCLANGSGMVNGSCIQNCTCLYNLNCTENCSRLGSCLNASNCTCPYAGNSSCLLNGICNKSCTSADYLRCAGNSSANASENCIASCAALNSTWSLNSTDSAAYMGNISSQSGNISEGVSDLNATNATANATCSFTSIDNSISIDNSTSVNASGKGCPVANASVNDSSFLAKGQKCMMDY